jgi:hypothetical protein
MTFLMVVYEHEFKECGTGEMDAGFAKNGARSSCPDSWSQTAHRRLQQDGTARANVVFFCLI